MPRHWLQLLTFLVAGTLLTAQDPTALGAAELEAKAKTVAERADVDEATKEKVQATYTTAITYAKAAAASQAAAAEATEAEKSAPGLLTTARAALAEELPALPTEAELTALELAPLEEQLRDTRARGQKLAADLIAKEAERQGRTEFLAGYPQSIVAARDELAKLPSSPIEGAPEDPPVLKEARAERRAVRLQALRAKVEELEARKRRFDAESELLTAQRDDLARRAERARQRTDLLDKAVQQRRLAEAKKAAEAAEQQVQEAQRVSKALANIARDNQELAVSREKWLKKLAEISAELTEVKKLDEGIKERFEKISKRIEGVGLTEAIGLQLRQMVADMPQVRRYEASMEARRGELDEAFLALVDLQEARDAFRSRSAEILPEEIAKLDRAPSEALLARIQREGKDLLDKREEYYGELTKALEEYRDKLVELDGQEGSLIKTVREKQDFVNQRVLWIRSTQPVWSTEWKLVGESAAWFRNPTDWRATWDRLVEGAGGSPARFALLSLLALLLIVFGRPACRRLAVLAEQAANTRATSFAPSAWALVMTFVAAAGWPLLLWHAGKLVTSVAEDASFALAFGSGLAHAAVLLGVLAVIRVAMRPDGLAEAHLRWPAARTRLFRHHLTWFVLVVVPLAVVLQMLSVHAEPRWNFELDRLVLIAILVVIAVFQARVLHPESGALSGYDAPGGVWKNTRLWYLLGVGVPSALVIVAAMGYHLSALELLYRLEQSLVVLGIAILVHGLGMRWMMLAKRRLAMAQARARREALKAKGGETASEGQSDAVPMPEESISIASVDAQSRKLLGGGLLLVVALALWGIWVDVLPALRALEEFVVWGEGTDEAVSLANMLMALVTLTITVVAARNIPGLLELLLLQRLKIHAGERYAATTLVRYLIATVGIVLSFSSIGIGWDKVQWLVAAVSVGLGFGLQEIFANFVSGLIILFERPIRIGDLVTVGQVDGYVTRIRMRATTIMDFDRKEMIVPNKAFVTESLINWTLTDPVTRVIVSVGVAYGSDTDLARKLLLEVAAANPRVLEDPAPSAIFRRFGDSTLDFDLRVFLASREFWPEVVDSLHSAIDREFKRAKIEIAFPQRDLHVRTLGPLEQLMPRRPDAEPS